MHAEESSRLVRLSRVISRAEEVIEDPEAATDWLKSANTALEGATPLEPARHRLLSKIAAGLGRGRLLALS